MPALVYPSGDFVPFTKILSSEVNGKFNAITTLLNVTKLNYTNFQFNTLIQAVQLSNQAVYTDVFGAVTLGVSLPAEAGGLGFSWAATTADIAKVVQVNALGTALTLDVVPTDPTGKLYALNHFL